ncbi:hypothetical protein SFC66_04865 [Terribacillus saccharophilus]|uniref:hypothetical protein n=1 Tax=Terribacillus saccharophilus TaxID=361277 RepID=UPI003981FEC4
MLKHKFSAGFLLVSIFSLLVGLSGFLAVNREMGFSGALIFAIYMSPFVFIYGIFVSWLISKIVKPVNARNSGVYVILHGFGGLPFAAVFIPSQSSAALLFTAALGAFFAILFALIELALIYVTNKGRIGWLSLYLPLPLYLAVFIIGQIQSVPAPSEEAVLDDPGYSVREAAAIVTERHGYGENGGFPPETGKVEHWNMFGERFTRETVIETVPGEKEAYYVTLVEKNMDRQEVYKTTYLTSENNVELHNRVSEQQE